jgi:hypothetical protein
MILFVKSVIHIKQHKAFYAIPFISRRDLKHFVSGMLRIILFMIRGSTCCSHKKYHFHYELNKKLNILTFLKTVTLWI